jgi:hypothetical protein
VGTAGIEESLLASFNGRRSDNASRIAGGGLGSDGSVDGADAAVALAGLIRVSRVVDPEDNLGCGDIWERFVVA